MLTANVSARRVLPLMALTVFIEMAGFALALPMLPFWAQKFGAGPFAIGMMMSAYSIAQLIFTPIIGLLSDRFGRRRMIVITLVLEAVGLIGTALAWSVPSLIVARFIGGVGGSSIGSAQAVVADVTGPEDRAKGMGLVGAAIGIGFVVGPAVGAVLTIVGPSIPFWGAAVVTLIDALLVILILPETLGRRARTEGRGTDRSALRLPAVRNLIAVTLLFTAAFAAMETVLPLFTQTTLGWGAAQNGIAFAIFGVTLVIVQGGLIGRLVRRFGERQLLIAGLLLVGGGLAVLPLGGLFATIVIGAGLTTVGMALIYPTSSSLLSYAAPDDRQGATLGLARSAGALARVIGPALAGALYVLAPAAPFLVSGAISAGSVALVPIVAARVRTARVSDAPVLAGQPSKAD